MSSLTGSDIVCSLKLIRGFVNECLDESIDYVYSTLYTILKSISNITEFTNDNESLASQLLAEIRVCIKPGIDEPEYTFVELDEPQHIREKINMMAEMILSSIRYRTPFYRNFDDGVRRRKVVDGAIKSFLALNTFKPPRIELF